MIRSDERYSVVMVHVHWFHFVMPAVLYMRERAESPRKNLKNKRKLSESSSSDTDIEGDKQPRKRPRKLPVSKAFKKSKSQPYKTRNVIA